MAQNSSFDVTTGVDLQEAIALLRSKEFGVELKFGNYR